MLQVCSMQINTTIYHTVLLNKGQLISWGKEQGKCKPSGAEPTPVTPQPTTINENGLGAGAIAGIIIGSIAMPILAAAIIVPVIVIIWRRRRQCNNGNAMPYTI